jgi:hypothetical protein
MTSLFKTRLRAWNRVALILACALLLTSPVRPEAAQASRDAQLLVTVVDQTGGVLPGAIVTVTGLDEAIR